MFLLAAAALVTAQTVSGLAPVTPRVQARATVRIVRGTAVRFGDQQLRLQDANIRLADGSRQPARLVEFE